MPSDIGEVVARLRAAEEVILAYSSEREADRGRAPEGPAAELLQTLGDHLRRAASDASAVDRTQREQHDAESALLQACIAQIRDVVIITEATPIDEPGPRIVFVNDAFETTTGYSRAEAIGRTPRMLQGPDTSRDALDRIRAALAHGQMIREELVNYTKAGAQFCVELEIVPVRDAMGVLRHFVAIQRDVTARHRAQIELANSESRLRRLADALPIIVWTATAEGDVDYSNIAFSTYTGVPDSEPAGTRWQAALHADDLDRALATWTRSVQTGEPYETDFRLRSADGHYRWFHVQALPIRDESGVVTRWYGSGVDVHDVTSREHQATALAERRAITLESISDAFFTVDRELCFTYLNREAERLMGQPAVSLLGRSLTSATAGDPFGTSLVREGRLAIASGAAIAFEEYFARNDAWVEVNASPTLEGLAVQLRDVTQRRRHRNLLQESEERFRLLANATNDAVWDWDLVADTIWWSDGFATLFGFERDELASSIGGWMSRIHDDDRETVMLSVRTAIDSDAMRWSHEYSFVRRDGSLARVLDRANIVRDPVGRALRMVGGMTDVTEPRRAERQLREQATLLDKAQDAITVRDLDHRVLYWNRSAERLYGWTADEALGRSIRELLYRDVGVFEAANEAMLAHGEWVGELDLVDRAGQPLRVEARWTLVRRGGEGPDVVLSINTDITQRKKLEAQFLRAQRMESIGTLAGGIAHDLNNVLSPILMSVTALREDIADPETLEDLATIETCAQRGAGMVRQLLSFARGGERRLSEVHLGRIATDVQRLCKETFPKNITIRFAVAADLAAVSADGTQMHQLLTNLLVNARDAMPNGGTLTATFENMRVDDVYADMSIDAKAGDYVLATVEDTGIGMPPAVVDRIFEPFYTTKELGKGTGLGLSTAHAIVRDHGGFIHVYSEVGRGTRFRVYLPALVQRADAVAKDSEPADIIHGTGQLVLVIDDEAGIRDVARRVLERFGYRVLLAGNGAEAVAIYAQHRADIAVVLTDMAMPIMDGPTTIVALKSMNPQVRIVGSSGLGSEGNLAKAVDAGIRHFVPKPYTTETILRVIAGALADEP